MALDETAFDCERVNLYAQTLLSEYPALANNLNYKEIRQANAEKLVTVLSSWCLSGRIPTRTESVTVEWPDGVWQTFKNQYMPYWFNRKFPVRMKRQVFDTAQHHYFVCPHLVTDKRESHVRFMATGTRFARMFNEPR